MTQKGYIVKEKGEGGSKLTLIFILINVLISLIIFSYPGGLENNVLLEIFSFSRGTMFEVWRWITSLFLHLNASHLFFNMIGLYFFGRALENKVDRRWWLVIYFVSGILGNLAHVATNAAPVIGASGCMFGLMGAAMLLNPLKKVHIYVFPLPLGIVAIALAIFESMVVAGNFAVDMVANTAHVAGLIAGAIFAFFHSPKASLKGILLLVFLAVLLIILVPVFMLIAMVGSFILSIIEVVVGYFVYGAAGWLSFIWV